MLLIVLKLKLEINLDSFKGMDFKIKVKRDNGEKLWECRPSLPSLRN